MSGSVVAFVRITAFPDRAGYRFAGCDDPSSWPEWWLKDPDSFSLDDRIFRESRTVTVNGQPRRFQIPTGMFLGNAVRLVTVRAPPPGFDDQVQAVRYGSEEMTRLGVTAIVDPGGGGRVMRAYQEAYRRGLLKLRILQVYEGMWNTQRPEEIAAHFDAIPFQNLGDRFLRWRGTKWQIDGGAGTRSSWVLNPSFIWHQGRSFSRNLGPERMARLQPFRSYIKAGVKIAVGSDYGTSPYSPWIGLYALLTRKDLWGDVHNAGETIGIEDALRAMTLNNAFLTYSDQWTGSLEPGKVADMVVLDLKDIKELERNPERIWDMERSILLTLVDGRPSFQREGFRF